MFARNEVTISQAYCKHFFIRNFPDKQSSEFRLFKNKDTSCPKFAKFA